MRHISFASLRAGRDRSGSVVFCTVFPCDRCACGRFAGVGTRGTIASTPARRPSVRPGLPPRRVQARRWWPPRERLVRPGHRGVLPRSGGGALPKGAGSAPPPPRAREAPTRRRPLRPSPPPARRSRRPPSCSASAPAAVATGTTHAFRGTAPRRMVQSATMATIGIEHHQNDREVHHCSMERIRYHHESPVEVGLRCGDGAPIAIGQVT